MAQPTWHVVATVPDTMSAQALLTYLQAEGVPAMVQTDTALLGEARRCDILVPAESTYRARLLLAQGQFTDAELTFLATGEPYSGSDEDS
jgi:hypothetical protein